MSAICQDCKQPMTPGTACTLKQIKVGNQSLDRVTDHFDEPNGFCHDCNAPHGQLHHLGCDAERCPACGGQLISCGCWTDEPEMTPEERLVLAAPDLLEALKELLAASEADHGEFPCVESPEEPDCGECDNCMMRTARRQARAAIAKAEKS